MACKTNFVGGNCSSCKEGYFGENCEGMCPANCRLCFSNASCTACRSSFFGLTCEKKCSDRCAGSSCERNTGKCFQCKPNFTGVSCKNCSEDFEGEMCQGCVLGKYGLNCSDICPSTCKTNVCNPNGNCLTGCMPGMFGPTCENSCLANCELCNSNISCQTCKNGYQGELCSLRCSYGCNGSCYHDRTCIACAEGNYGELCNLSCPRHCNGGQCNKTGFCYDCISGHYGYDCEQICSSHCCNGTCSRDGTCKLCDTEEGQSYFEANIVWISVAGFLAVITFLLLAYILLLQRRLAHKDSTMNSIYTGNAILDTNTAGLEMATFLPRSEVTPVSDHNLQSAVYEIPRNTTTSDMDNGDDVSNAITSHVYSGPYELSAEFSRENINIVQRTYDTPTDGHYKNVAGADGTDRENRQYENLTSERGVKNYSVLREFK